MALTKKGSPTVLEGGKKVLDQLISPLLFVVLFEMVFSIVLSSFGLSKMKQRIFSDLLKSMVNRVLVLGLGVSHQANLIHAMV